jgi:type IX secretion system substrate protein
MKLMIKRITTLILIFVFTTSLLHAQSTLVEVYNILQQKCATCHSNADPQNGLDLEGTGATVTDRALDVFGNISNISPANSFANSKGYKYIYPGRPDLSFLFRKLNLGLEETIDFEEGTNLEEGTMPPYGQDQLTDIEKEMVRQWILYGAPNSGTVVDPQVISDYYTVNGLESFPDGAPEPPAEGEGFQVKMGPYFLKPAGQPGDELEYFLKYDLNQTLSEDTEVNRVDIKIGPTSHHLIIYDFNSPAYANQVPSGLRLNPDHSGISLVAAVQEATDLKLPEGTAFSWEDNIVLDLNSHYINYSSTGTLKAEAYVNIYTQDAGTAAQEMKTALLVNDDIYIPNNGNTDTEIDIVNANLGQTYVWGIMGHTHQWGTGYKVYKRENGTQGELIYDASCPGGIPGCVSPYFDYQHIPFRYIEPFMPLTFNFNNGIIHEATYINEGPGPVWFGPTSDDEMMVLVMMYTSDTTGVVFENPTAVEDLINPLEAVNVYPNPMNTHTTFLLPEGIGNVDFSLFNLLGQPIRYIENIDDQLIFLERGDLNAGMYLYRIEDENGRFVSGKIMVE